MDSGPKASLCHGEHVRARRMSCRMFEGFTFIHRVDDRKGIRTIPNRALAIKEFRCCDVTGVASAQRWACEAIAIGSFREGGRREDHFRITGLRATRRGRSASIPSLTRALSGTTLTLAA